MRQAQVTPATLHQRILDGDEIALRTAFRAYAPSLTGLSRRILDPESADEVVVEAFALAWREPQRWLSPAIDVHLHWIVRQMAFEVRRHGIDVRRAASELEPPPLTPTSDVASPDPDLDRAAVMRAWVRLPEAHTRALEDAWVEQQRGDEATLSAAFSAFTDALCVLSDLASRADPTPTEPELALFCLGLMSDDELTRFRRQLRSNPALRRRASIGLSRATALTLAVTTGSEPAESRLEQRLIQQARQERPPRVRSFRALRVVRRGLLPLLVIALVSLVALFGYLAFRPPDPIDGVAIALSDDGVTGVLLPQYESQLFALAFWGLPEAQPDQRWQLWIVRESGAIEPGPFFERDDEARAVVSINPNRLTSDDALIGFAISLDDPTQRVAGTPSSDRILYQFASR